MQWRVDQTLDSMRESGLHLRESLSLSLDIREHYLHETRTVIDRDLRQVASHEAWFEELQARAAALRTAVQPDERAHLDVLVEESAALDQAFRESVLPAAVVHDHEQLAAAHRRAARHLRAATDAADAVADSLVERMAVGRQRAQRAMSTAMVAGCSGIVSIVLLAIFFSVQLRGAITLPLRKLAEAAGRIGRGERAAPAGQLGRGEIAVVARAFDSMAQAIDLREAALLRSERLAAVGELAAGVAHEINNPIGVIRGYLKTMIPESRDPEQAAELAILDEEAAACERIVEDLLAFGRDPDLRFELVDIRALLEERATRVRATEAAKGVDIGIDVEDARLEVDPIRFRQVIDNLLLNAVEYSSAGHGVEVFGRRVPPAVYRIEVRDRGPGIDQDERERVFDAFRSSRPGGTGLGLAVARALVEAHRGEISALPRGDGGTVMRVELPFGQEGP